MRALDVAGYDRSSGRLTIRAAMKGASASSPRRSTKECNFRRIIIDAELRVRIEAHVAREDALTRALTSRGAGETLRAMGPLAQQEA